jgi:hypothetical protein
MPGKFKIYTITLLILTIFFTYSSYSSETSKMDPQLIKILKSPSQITAYNLKTNSLKKKNLQITVILVIV